HPALIEPLLHGRTPVGCDANELKDIAQNSGRNPGDDAGQCPDPGPLPTGDRQLMAIRVVPDGHDARRDIEQARDAASNCGDEIYDCGCNTDGRSSEEYRLSF